MGQGSRRGRHRRRHRRQAAPAHRRQRAHRDRRPGAPLPRHRHHDVRLRRLAGDRDDRGLRSPRRPGPLRQGRARGLDPRRGRQRHVRGAGASQPGRGAAAGQGPDRGRAGPLHARRPQGVHLDHPGRAARLRRRRAAGRGVHDLQLAVDHGRPALARVRAAAPGRCLAAPGAAHGRGRGAGHGRRAPAWSGSRPATGWPRASTRCSRRSASTCRRPARSSPRARSSSRCWSACS